MGTKIGPIAPHQHRFLTLKLLYNIMSVLRDELQTLEPGLVSLIFK